MGAEGIGDGHAALGAVLAGRFDGQVHGLLVADVAGAACVGHGESPCRTTGPRRDWGHRHAPGLVATHDEDVPRVVNLDAAFWTTIAGGLLRDGGNSAVGPIADIDDFAVGQAGADAAVLTVGAGLLGLQKNTEGLILRTLATSSQSIHSQKNDKQQRFPQHDNLLVRAARRATFRSTSSTYNNWPCCPRKKDEPRPLTALPSSAT
jgi:hypothetical protein